MGGIVSPHKPLPSLKINRNRNDLKCELRLSLHPRRQKHRLPVKLQIRPLSLRKPADIPPPVRRDSHAPQRLAVHDRRDQKLAIVLECNEPAIEEMIDGGREQQAVLAVEALVVGLARGTSPARAAPG